MEPSTSRRTAMRIPSAIVLTSLITFDEKHPMTNINGPNGRLIANIYSQVGKHP
jgi:hypothetical protein